MKNRAISLLLIVFSLSIPVGSLGQSQVLHLGNGGEPKDLDPHLVTGNPEGKILLSLFEGLVGKDPRTLEIRPGVAERWEISKDGRRVTFYLRKNAKWSNGESVTAKDFVYSWTRFRKPETGAEYAAHAEPIESTTEKGPHVFEVKLKTPVPHFLELITHWSFFPVHQGTIEKNGMRWTRPENFVANGPFILKSWDINKAVVVEKSLHYWDREKVRLDRVHFHAVAKPEVEEKMFRAGQIHSVADIPLDKLDYWEREGSGAFHRSPYLGIYFYWFNIAKKPLDDIRVRKALSLGFDRERLIKYVTKGKQLPATAFTPPNCGGYTAKAVLPKAGEGIGEAKKLLAEAGFPEGKGFPTIEVLYNSNENIKRIAEGIQGMWKENLGISVMLVNNEWKVFLDNQAQKNFFISRAGWTADYNDPTSFLRLHMTNDGNNHSGWSNKTYDELITKAASDNNKASRLKAFSQAEKLLLESHSVMPIYFYTRLTLRSPKVKGWYDNPQDYHPLHYVYLEN